MNTDVKLVRGKIIDFVKSKGGKADYSDIKSMLGLEQYKYYGFLEKALKTTKLTPVYGSGKIGPVGLTQFILARKPIIAFELTLKS